jgi:hypothetical protein
VSKHTIHAWKAKFGGMKASEAQKLRALEDENGRLKRLVADLTAIILGDLKEGRVLRQAGGFAIKRLVELYAATNKTGYILYARPGGYNVNAGTNPIRSLVRHG